MDAVDRDIAIRTVLSEAGNQGALGQAAVANVLRNRAQSGRYGGQDLASVALAPHQFEPWSRGTLGKKNDPTAIDPNSPEYESAGRIVDAVMSGQHPDPTGGATHFYSPGSQAALGRDAPSWAKGQPGTKIGDQMFYNLDPTNTVSQISQNNAVAVPNNTLAGQNNAVAPQNNAVANPQTMPSPTASAVGMPPQGAGSAPAGGPQMPPNMQQLMAMLMQHQGAQGGGQPQQPAPGLLARLLTGGQPGQGQGLSSMIPTPNNGAGLFGMAPQEGGAGGKPAIPQQPQMGGGQPQAGGLAALLQHLFGGGGGSQSPMPPATA